MTGTSLTLFCALLLWPALGLFAAEIEVEVTGAGKPLPGAVVSLHPAQAANAAQNARAVMDQRGSAFVPGVLPIQAGTLVSFPNSDQIQHQVYSFSPSKRFELPLYAGKAASPIRFDQPGVVVVGCNIHDWMTGYIVVLDTPYFAVTDSQGRVRLEAPAGDYRLQAWHARLQGAPVEQKAGLTAGKPVRAALSLEVTPETQSRPADERLRALQEKFRKLKQKP